MTKSGSPGYWIDAARAAAALWLEARGVESATSLGVVIARRGSIEWHRVRIDPGARGLRQIIREEVALVPNGPPFRTDVFAVAPGVPNELVRNIQALATKWGARVLLAGALEPEFARIWKARLASEIAGPSEFAYRLHDWRPGWGTAVPASRTIHSDSSGFVESRPLEAGGALARNLELGIEERRVDGSLARAWRIAPGSWPGLRLATGLMVDLAVCPNTGSGRWVISGRWRGCRHCRTPHLTQGSVCRVCRQVKAAENSRISLGIRWPIEQTQPNRAAPLERSSVRIAVCVAVDERTAQEVWDKVARLLEGLIGLGRVGHVQIVWSNPEATVQATGGWAPEALRSKTGRLRSQADLRGDDAVMPSRGLSEGLREALLGAVSTADAPLSPVGLVLADSRYSPGSDPAFRTVEGRWAWSIRMRRKLGSPFSLLAYAVGSNLVDSGESLREALAHLVLLGRQARSSSHLIPTWESELMTSDERLDEEIGAILAVADRDWSNFPTEMGR